MGKAFGTPAAFRQALEARLRAVAAARGAPINDVRLKLVIERLLARLFAKADPPWLLKGGYAMELRYRPHARTTKDIDLSVPESNEAAIKAPMEWVREELQDAADLDVGDFLRFRIGTPKGELPGAPLGGARFPVQVLLAGNEYGRFHIDVGFGDALIGQPEPLEGEDLLAFAGIPPARAMAIPKPQQFAEKIHAYTYPWTDRTNTRTKDLVDLVLLIERGNLDRAAVRAALRETFARRNSHQLPAKLPAPPPLWSAEFKAMARHADLHVHEVEGAFLLLEEFWSQHELGSA
jgi:hypothetical protein